ncbi:hypothetical protein P8452_56159 [Trifolium repens]|nr:hypothetical protein P8452_56159 [Trifolium repens]
MEELAQTLPDEDVEDRGQAVEREQPSVKDSCNPVDFDTIPKGISPIKIYAASPSRKLVARGKLHNTTDAPLPIPVEDGEVSTIGEAVGTIVAWPFHLVEFVGECRKTNNKLQNKDKKMMARSAESVASPTKTRKKFKNQETSPDVGDSKNLGFLRTFVTHMWAADSVLGCPQQTNTTDYGYFVTRFMKEIVMQYPKKIPEKYFDEYKCRTYSKDKLDEVKDEWAEYMFTNVIPGGSWIKEFLKT